MQQQDASGTNMEQDNWFSNKQKKLLRQMKSVGKKVALSKVNLEVIKPWVTE